jgi:RNA polymerase sigma-70 factor (ECF subfamily)
MGSDPPGDAAQLAFERYSRHVYRFLLKRTRDHHDAEVLTQRVFAEAAEALRQPSARPTNVLAWLYTVAERRFIDETRRRITSRRHLMMLIPPAAAPDLAYSDEVVAALRRTIAALPEDQRTIVVRKVICGDSFADIARDLGITIAACKMRLSRAMVQLRRDLEEAGVTRDE